MAGHARYEAAGRRSQPVEPLASHLRYIGQACWVTGLISSLDGFFGYLSPGAECKGSGTLMNRDSLAFGWRLRAKHYSFWHVSLGQDANAVQPHDIGREAGHLGQSPEWFTRRSRHEPGSTGSV